MTASYPALLDLRGNFVDPHLQQDLPVWFPRLTSILDIFPIDDEQAIIHAYTHVALINIRSQEVLWSIACRPSFYAALDKERSSLALAPQGAISLWDLRNGQLVQNLAREGSPVVDMVFNPEGSLLALAHYDGGVQLWHVADGQRGHLLDDDDACGYKSIAFSPDGKYLASGTPEDNRVWLWKVADGQLLRMMQIYPDAERVKGLTFSPDGKFLVGGDFSGGDQVNQTHVWDVATGQLVHGFGQKTWLPTFSVDGKLLASTFITFPGKNDKARYSLPSDPICLWNVADRRLLRSFKGHKERIQRLAFSPSGRMLLSCSDDHVASWWDCESGQEAYRLESCFSTRASGAFSADRRFLACGLKDGALSLWLIDEGEFECAISAFPGGQGLEGIAISSDGTYIASWVQTAIVPGSLYIWRKDASRPLDFGNQKWVYCAAFSPKSEFVAAGCGDHAIHIWNIAEGERTPRRSVTKPVHILKQHVDDVRCLAFSPDDSFLASGSRDRTICLWKLGNNDAPWHILQGHEQEVTALAFSPDGKLLASGSEDRSIRIWDVCSGQLLHIIEGHAGTVTCLAFNLDGNRLASGSTDGSIRVWSVNDGTPQPVQDKAPQTVIERAFALEGGPVESNVQESIWLWEIPPAVATYHIQPHHTRLTSLAFKPDNTLLASGYCDGPTQAWRLETL